MEGELIRMAQRMLDPNSDFWKEADRIHKLMIQQMQTHMQRNQTPSPDQTTFRSRSEAEKYFDLLQQIAMKVPQEDYVIIKKPEQHGITTKGVDLGKAVMVTMQSGVAQGLRQPNIAVVYVDGFFGSEPNVPVVVMARIGLNDVNSTYMITNAVMQRKDAGTDFIIPADKQGFFLERAAVFRVS